jgi:hypothetical protein
MTTEITIIPSNVYNQLVSLSAERLKEAEGLVLEKVDDLDSANMLLKKTAATEKAIEEKRKEMVTPLNERVKEINGAFKAISTALAAANDLLKRKILVFRQDEEARRQKLIDEQSAAQAAAEKKAKKAKATGKPEPVYVAPPAPLPLAAIDSTTVRKTWTFEVVDEKSIPRNFMVLNEKMVREQIRNGVREIAGLRIFQQDTVVAR